MYVCVYVCYVFMSQHTRAAACDDQDVTYNGIDQACVCMYVYTHMYTYMHAYGRRKEDKKLCLKQKGALSVMHAYIHTHIYTYMYAYIHAYIQQDEDNKSFKPEEHFISHTCMHTYIYVYIHAYIYTHKRK